MLALELLLDLPFELLPFLLKLSFELLSFLLLLPSQLGSDFERLRTWKHPKHRLCLVDTAVVLILLNFKLMRQRIGFRLLVKVFPVGTRMLRVFHALPLDEEI